MKTVWKRKEGRLKRLVHLDGNFRRGMRYTDSFIQNQAVKLLVNYDIMDNGTFITPRKGISGQHTDLGEFSGSLVPAPHVAYYGTYYDQESDLDKYGNIVLSFGTPDHSDYASYLTSRDVPADYYEQLLDGHQFGTITIDGETIVADIDLPPARTCYYNDEPRPIYTIFNYSLYYLGVAEVPDGETTITKNSLIKVIVEQVSPGVVEIRGEVVEGKEVSLGEATSLGFNLMHPTPYNFENEISLTFSPMGIIPYSTANEDNLMLSANVGEPVKFVLYYYHPDPDSPSEVVTFKVKWEQAVLGSRDYVVLHDYDDEVYTAGDEVSITVPTIAQDFTLRCTMVPFDEDLIEEPTEEDEGFDGLLMLQSKVGIYPVFTVGESELRDTTQNQYDLQSATGIAKHNEMLILWGVPGAETALFFSDVLDPTYFPFPHYTYSFADPIMAVQSFSGALFVFTERRIYLIEGPNMYEMTDPRPIYENLEFTKEDLRAIISIKDGMFLRSKDKYYMLVPNVYTGHLSDMRLIPISDQVEGLIFEWKGFLRLLSERLFKFNVSWGENTSIKQYDFFNYASGVDIRNVYRFAIFERRDEELFRYQVDVILVYNTEMNIWRVEVASFPYNGVVPQSKTLYSSYVSQGMLYLQALRYNNNNCKDTYNTMYYGEAVNDSATSIREQELQLLDSIGYDTLVRVIDGDTVELEQLGRTRLLWVDTPESTGTIEPYGVEATNFLVNLIPEGSTVFYEFDTGGRADLYDRALVWLSFGGFLIQEELAKRGYVKAIFDFGATSPNIDIVQAAIDEAIANKIGLYQNLQPEGPYTIRNRSSAMMLGNFQIIDTGNREQNSYLEKRYKEIQFMLHNSTSNILKFGVEFYLDAQRRQAATRFEVEHNTDENSPDYGTIYVREVEETNLEVLNETELGFWELDISNFPVTEILKVIFKVSGRGHYPRFVLVSRNEEPYKLLNYSWVYRNMNAR